MVNEALPGQMTVQGLRDLLAVADPHALVVFIEKGDPLDVLHTVEVEDHGAAVVIRPTPLASATELLDRAIEGLPAKAEVYRRGEG